MWYERKTSNGVLTINLSELEPAINGNDVNNNGNKNNWPTNCFITIKLVDAQIHYMKIYHVVHPYINKQEMLV